MQDIVIRQQKLLAVVGRQILCADVDNIALGNAHQPVQILDGDGLNVVSVVAVGASKFTKRPYFTCYLPIRTVVPPPETSAESPRLSINNNDRTCGGIDRIS
jgi:hypothetical protein